MSASLITGTINRPGAVRALEVDGYTQIYVGGAEHGRAAICGRGITVLGLCPPSITVLGPRAGKARVDGGHGPDGLHHGPTDQMSEADFARCPGPSELVVEDQPVDFEELGRHDPEARGRRDFQARGHVGDNTSRAASKGTVVPSSPLGTVGGDGRVLTSGPGAGGLAGAPAAWVGRLGLGYLGFGQRDRRRVKCRHSPLHPRCDRPRRSPLPRLVHRSMRRRHQQARPARLAPAGL